MKRPEPFFIRDRILVDSCHNGGVSMVCKDPLLALSEARALHTWLGAHLAAHDAATATKPPTAPASESTSGEHVWNGSDFIPVPLPTAPAPTPVAHRVPGCGEWVNFDDCAFLSYLAPDPSGTTDYAADAYDDGDWWAYPQGHEGEPIAKGTAPGDTPSERLAAAKRAAEDALIAEAARVAAELQQEKTANAERDSHRVGPEQGDFGEASAKWLNGAFAFYARETDHERCEWKTQEPDGTFIAWVHEPMTIAEAINAAKDSIRAKFPHAFDAPPKPRHNSADDVPTQTAWEVAVSLYPHARYVAYDVGVRAIAERVFRTGQPVDAAEAELFGVYLAGRIEGRIIPELFGEGAQGRAAWSAAVDAAIPAPAEIGPPAGTHDALPEPTRNGCDGGMS